MNSCEVGLNTGCISVILVAVFHCGKSKKNVSR